MPKLLALYHYYSPDDVAGAQQFTGLCEGMAARGYEAEVWPSNRNCHNPKAKYPLKVEELNGVKIRRVWRPAWRQHSNLGRILSAVWMMKLWFWRFLFSPGSRPDVLFIGTDPIFCLGVVPFLKLVHPKMKVVHWCFDLYPEYAIANGMAKENGLIAGALRWWMGRSYRKCDLVADIGPCMREKLKRYKVQKAETLTPWALEEPSGVIPPDPKERKELFGTEPIGDASAGSSISARATQSSPLGLKASGQGEASLALLYSGNFGLPHEFYLTLKLARAMKGDGLVLSYGAHGSRLAALQKALNPEDTNVRFASFAPVEKLAARLSAPDVHMVSLRSPWSGFLVPSKFFGALAVGRPVLYEGPGDSDLALWIREYQVGWVLDHDAVEEVREELLAFLKSAKEKAEMFAHCHEVYQAHFSRRSVLEKWDLELRKLTEDWLP